MTVRSFVGFLVWQLHFRHDLADDAVIFENASVSQQRESLSLGVVYDATAREVFVFRFTGSLAVQPPLFPNVDVAAGMGEVYSVWFGLAERRAVDDQVAIDHPEDTD